MALKFKLLASTYNALPDAIKGEYIAGEKDGEYVLDVTDLPQGEDPAPIKRALDNERNAHKATKEKLGAAETTIANAPDVAALRTQHETEVGKLKAFAESTLIDGAASALAAKISKSPALIVPHIKARLIADMTGDKPVTKVIGADGKPSELTIDALGQEFVANKDFASIMIASKASGGGAPQTPIRPFGGGAPKDGEQKPDLTRMSPADLAARITARRAEAAQNNQ